MLCCGGTAPPSNVLGGTPPPPSRHGTTILYSHLYEIRQDDQAKLEQAWGELKSLIRNAVVDVGLTCFRVGIYWRHVVGKDVGPRGEDISGSSSIDLTYFDRILAFLLELREETGKAITVVPTIGMKAPAWPEFYLPSKWEAVVSAHRFGRRGSDISLVPGLEDASLAFSKAALELMTVQRSFGVTF